MVLRQVSFRDGRKRQKQRWRCLRQKEEYGRTFHNFPSRASKYSSLAKSFSSPMHLLIATALKTVFLSSLHWEALAWKAHFRFCILGEPNACWLKSSYLWKCKYYEERQHCSSLIYFCLGIKQLEQEVKILEIFLKAGGRMKMNTE